MSDREIQAVIGVAAIVIVFLAGLAAQFRGLAASVLHLNLSQHDPALTLAERRAAIAAASRTAPSNDPAVAWLRENHAAPLAQLRWARRGFTASLFALALLLGGSKLAGWL